jgi:hypothetical protein
VLSCLLCHQQAQVWQITNTIAVAARTLPSGLCWCAHHNFISQLRASMLKGRAKLLLLLPVAPPVACCAHCNRAVEGVCARRVQEGNANAISQVTEQHTWTRNRHAT